uniref:ERAP1_C domain-containing protein n=1 Tax=Anisakis simplex TaxID=6269 RepID=A0A0M3JCL0_ANISI
LNQLQDDPLVFDELTRAQFLSDAIALQQRGSLDWNRVMDIVATLQKEGELAAWYTFKPTLELFMEMFQNTDVWDKLTAFIGRIISEQYSSLGWQKTGDWSHENADGWMSSLKTHFILMAS